MVIKGVNDESVQGRVFYPLGEDLDLTVNHFVVRTTTPDNPFEPHEHEESELWFILEGRGELELGEEVHAVGAGDLVRLDPWVRHGLRTASQIRWVCLG